MERLSREGTRYSNAVAPAPWTLPTHASLFSGKLPTEHGISGECFVWADRRPKSPARAIRDYAGSWLPEAMRERGYRTWGASCNTWVSRWGGFDRGFDEFLDVRPWAKPRDPVRRFAFRARRLLGMEDRGGGRAVQEFSRALGSTGTEPLFAFLNLMETHSPFNPPARYYPFPEWRRRKTFHLAGGPDQQLSYNSGMVDAGPEYATTLRRIYFACARYADEILGRFIQVIEQRGRPTVVAVVADHGENLGEHGLFNHNTSLHQPLLHVPLILWGSGADLEGGEVDDPVSTVKLAEWVPSVADGGAGPIVLNGNPVSEYEGTYRHNGIPKYIEEALEHADMRVPPLLLAPGIAVRKGPLKYVAVADGTATVFDLEADPQEDRDLLPSRPELARHFEADREAWYERRSHRPAYEPGETAEGEIAEHLRELGYIE